MTTARPAAVVLCGGESRRMGRDKAGLPFGGESLVERVLRLVGQEAAEVVVAAAVDQPVPEGFRVVRDAVPGGGPLPALLDALDGITSEFAFIVACDTPLLQPGLIPLLVSYCTGWDAAVPTIDGRRMVTCAVYRVDALRKARAAFGDPRHRSLRAYLQPLRIRDVPAEALRAVDPALLSFTPCNTPDEYEAALRLAGFAVNSGSPPTV